MKQKQTTITLKVSEKTKMQMIEYFDDLKRFKTPPYAVFQADDGGTVVTLYESGKCVFQGFDADLASEFWIATEKINSGTATVTNSNDKKEDKKKDDKVIPLRINSIGSDEVGTGDYFGPIVVSSAYVSKENIPWLEELGVKDSKKLTDDKILEIVPQIVKKIPYKSMILTNKEYNERYSADNNMNKLKAILHNNVLVKLTSEIRDYDYVIVDEFAKKNVYFSYLKESNNVFRNITFMTKGEDKSLAVACASMISRFIFIKEFDKLGDKIDEFLPKGAGDAVNEIGKKIVDKYGDDILRDIAKLNFKNTEKILEKEQ